MSDDRFTVKFLEDEHGPVCGVPPGQLEPASSARTPWDSPWVIACAVVLVLIAAAKFAGWV